MDTLSTKAQKIAYSAPGKCILTGEHSVVYGYNAIAIAVNIRTVCTLEYLLDKPLSEKNFCSVALEANNSFFCIDTNQKLLFIGEDFMKRHPHEYDYVGFRQECYKSVQNMKLEEGHIQFCYFFCLTLLHLKARIGAIDESAIVNAIKRVHISLHVKSGIPLARGLGSSASFSVTVAATISHFWIELLRATDGLSETQKLKAAHLLGSKSDFEQFVNIVAYDFEKIFHGNPSGVDNLTVLLGGAVCFNKTSPQPSSNLHSPILTRFRLLLIDTGIEKDTKKAVDMVRRQKEDSIMGSTYTALLESCGRTTDAIKSILELNVITDDVQTKLEELIYINEKLLEGLGLGHAKNLEIVNICTKFGFPCKITGAGLGGSCLCLVNKAAPDGTERLNALANELKSHKFEYLILDLAQNGLQKEISGPMPSL